MTRRLIAASGTGVAWLVDEAEEPEPPPGPPADDPEVVVVPAEFARAVVGAVEASVCTVDVRADAVVEDESEPLVAFVLGSALVEEEDRGELDEGVSVGCDPLAIAEVRPDTLCACVEVPFDPWI